MNASLSHLSPEIDRYEKNSLGVGKKKKDPPSLSVFFCQDCEKTTTIHIKEQGTIIDFIVN
jgi:hypothetical protein